MKSKVLDVTEIDHLGLHHKTGFLVYCSENKEVEEYYTCHDAFLGYDLKIELTEYNKAKLQRYLDAHLSEQNEFPNDAA